MKHIRKTGKPREDHSMHHSQQHSTVGIHLPHINHEKVPQSNLRDVIYDVLRERPSISEPRSLQN